MSQSFDPYYTWLGIPAEEQPPDHYRLIGVRRFEENRDVIANAMDRQMQYLRSMQVGKHSAESQLLLNEVAAAAACLLDPQRKAEYDRQLRMKMDSSARSTLATSTRSLPVAATLSPASRPVPLPAPAAGSELFSIAVPQGAPAIRPAKRAKQTSVVVPVAIGGAAGLVVLLIVALIASQFWPSQKPASTNGATAKTPTRSGIRAAPTVTKAGPGRQAEATTEAGKRQSESAGVSAVPPAPAPSPSFGQRGRPSPTHLLNDAQWTPSPNAAFSSLLGNYMYWLDRKKMHPIVNLQVPNKNLWTDEVKANAAGRASEDEISYAGTAKFVVPASGVYLLETDRAARIWIDGQLVTEWENPRTEINLTQGLHLFSLEIGSHGQPHMQACFLRLRNKDNGEEVTFFNTWQEIEEFLNTPINGQRVVEVSGWQPTPDRELKLDDKMLALIAAGPAGAIRPQKPPENSSEIHRPETRGLAKQPKLKAKIGKSESVIGHMGLSFRHDGKVLAYTIGDKDLHFWDVDAGKELPKITGAHRHGTRCIAFSPDGNLVASGGGGSDFKLWDARSSKAVLTAEVPTDCVAFARDGMLAATGGWDGNVTLWDVEKKVKLASLPSPEGDVLVIAFSPNGKTLVSAGMRENGVMLWDVGKRAVIGQRKEHETDVRGLAFHKDGDRFASVSADLGPSLKLWTLEAEKPALTAKPNGFPYSLAWSPDGKRIATGDFEGAVSVWNAEDLKLLATIPPGSQGIAHALAFSPTTGILAVGTTDCVVRLWELP